MAQSRTRDAMLTPGEVAGLLSVNINTVRRWTNKGLLKAYRIGTRGDRRFREEDIASFISEESSIAKEKTGEPFRYTTS